MALQCERNRPPGVWIAALALGVASLGGAAGGDEPPPPVELERLMRLPDSIEFESTKRGGATPAEWRARFRAARQEQADAQAALDRAREELDELAGEGGSWTMSAPGVSAASSAENPISYRLVQEIRRHREEVERTESRLRELQIEANLAGVPADWHE